MGADAEESLAHDDKRRDVEDKVRGQIVEIQAIVEHEPSDKWVEGSPVHGGNGGGTPPSHGA